MPGSVGVVGTGIILKIPDGFEVQVRPRSGLAARHMITVLNSPGTIDSDYREELKVILFNCGSKPYIIKNGDRIAQMVPAAIAQIDGPSDNIIVSSERNGGLGSTGK